MRDSAVICMPMPSPATRRSIGERRNQPPRITHVACMAHARRKLFEVFDATNSPIAEEALRQIQEPLCHRGRDQRQAGRSAPERSGKTRSKPLLDAFHAWAHGATTTTLGQGAAWESIPIFAEPMGCS